MNKQVTGIGEEKMGIPLYWKSEQTPEILRPMLTELGGFYPVRQGGGSGISLAFECVKKMRGCEAGISGQSATIRYATPSHAARAIGALLSGLVSENRPYVETTPFETLGIMLDCSRNAVMTVEHIKAWLRQLARRLKRHADSRETGNVNYAFATARAFAKRYQLSTDLLRAYQSKDRAGIHAAKRRIGQVAESLLAMEDAFRDMWMSHNKPEGIETIQARFGMLQARYRELERRLAEYLHGEIDCIAELESKCPPQ
jgi:hypothetical protein